MLTLVLRCVCVLAVGGGTSVGTIVGVDINTTAIVGATAAGHALVVIEPWKLTALLQRFVQINLELTMLTVVLTDRGHVIGIIRMADSGRGIGRRCGRRDIVGRRGIPTPTAVAASRRLHASITCSLAEPTVGVVDP